MVVLLLRKVYSENGLIIARAQKKKIRFFRRDYLSWGKASHRRRVASWQLYLRGEEHNLFSSVISLPTIENGEIDLPRRRFAVAPTCNCLLHAVTSNPYTWLLEESSHRYPSHRHTSHKIGLGNLHRLNYTFITNILGGLFCTDRDLSALIEVPISVRRCMNKGRQGCCNFNMNFLPS